MKRLALSIFLAACGGPLASGSPDAGLPACATPAAQHCRATLAHCLSGCAQSPACAAGCAAHGAKCLAAACPSAPPPDLAPACDARCRESAAACFGGCTDDACVALCTDEEDDCVQAACIDADGGAK